MQKDIKYIQSYILKSKNFIKLEAICIKRGEDYEKKNIISITGIGNGKAHVWQAVAGNKSSESKSSGKVTKITIAVPDPEASYIYQAATEFADRAEKYSNNTLEFTVSGNGSLYGGDTAAGIKQLSAGSLQMLILATSVYASLIRHIM